jgi:hypothetical protein
MQFLCSKLVFDTELSDQDLHTWDTFMETFLYEPCPFVALVFPVQAPSNILFRPFGSRQKATIIDKALTAECFGRRSHQKFDEHLVARLPTGLFIIHLDVSDTSESGSNMVLLESMRQGVAT